MQGFPSGDVPLRRIASIAALLVAVACPAVLSAQQKLAVLRGQVLTDSAEIPIRAAEVSLPRLRISTMTDSLGHFRLTGIPSGREIVTVRRVGFQQITTQLNFAAGDSIDTDFLMLRAAQTLPGVQVKGKKTTARMADFERRRASGFGHFLTETDLDKAEGRAISDVMNSVPALRIYRSNVSTAAWAVSSRGQQSVDGVFKPEQYDRNRGAPPNQCYAAVVLDGVPVFTGRPGQMLFDLNTLSPKNLAGIEVYGGNATLPPELNFSGNTCGAIVLWMR